MRTRDIIERVITWAALVFFAFFFLYPFWNVIWGSVKTIPQFSSTLIFEPIANPTFEPFMSALAELARPLWVSFLVAAFTVLISVVFGALGGYCLSRSRYKLTGTLLALVLFGLYIPGVTKLIPLLRVTQLLGIYNTPWGVGIAIGSVQLPISTVLYRQYYKQLPESLFESARISGANHLHMFSGIVIPLSQVPAVTVAVQAFTIGWNNLLFPLVLTSGTASSRPAAITVANLRIAAQREATYNQMLSAGIIAAIPVIVLYLVFQRYVTGGFRQIGMGGK